MKRHITIELEGVDYKAELAVIERTHLGFEDHGILAVGMHFMGDGWGQGDGLRFTQDGYGMAYVKAVLEVVGVSTWEELRGKEVYVLREQSVFNTIRGIAHRREDRAVIFETIEREKLSS